MRIGIVNSLPGVLGHFQRALIDNLGLQDEVDVVVLETLGTEMPEGSTGIDRIRRAVRFIRDVRRTAGEAEVDCLINLWPTFGYLDALLWRIIRPSYPILTILHDVEPLRRQFGYWHAAIRPLGLQGRPRHQWIVHTEMAAREAVRLELGSTIVIPHPVLPAESATIDPSIDVLVFGQYKPARDLELLNRLGPQLVAAGKRICVVGRGWPTLDGWEVDEGFVDETSVSKLLGDARTVLIPYERYFQSGVALRAIEASTPVVGVRTEFLEAYLGDQWAGFVEPEDEAVSSWLAAVERADAIERPDVLRAARVARLRVSAAWWDALSNAVWSLERDDHSPIKNRNTSG